MIKSFPILFVLLLTASVSFAQRSEVRDVSRFDRVSHGISGTLYLSQGPVQKLELRGDRDDLEKVVTEVRGDRLVIKTRSDRWLNWSGNTRVDIYLTVTDLESITLPGSGKIIGQNKIKSDFLEVGVSGSGRIELETEARETDISISGSGKITLSGEGNRSKISISGSGKVSAEEFTAESYSVRISGSGSCRVHAKESIDARISGSGSVYYRGDPRHVNSHSSGSGKVRKI